MGGKERHMVLVLWKKTVSSKEVRTVVNGLMSVTCLPPGTRMTSRLGLLPRIMSGSMVLLELLSVLVFILVLPPRTWGCLGSGPIPVAILVSAEAILI